MKPNPLLVSGALDRVAALVVWAALVGLMLAYAPARPDDVWAMLRPKVALVQSAALLLGAVFLARAAWTRGAPSVAAPVPRALAWLLTALVAWWFAATAASWPGDPELADRLRGCLVMVIYVACGAALPSVRRTFFVAFPITAAALALTVLLQHHGVVLPGWTHHDVMQLPGGTFVHRNSPGYLMAIALVPAVLAALDAVPLRHRIGWGAVATVLLAAIVASRSRGAWGAVLLALVLAGVARRRTRLRGDGLVATPTPLVNHAILPLVALGAVLLLAGAPGAHTVPLPVAGLAVPVVQIASTAPAASASAATLAAATAAVAVAPGAPTGALAAAGGVARPAETLLERVTTRHGSLLTRFSLWRLASRSIVARPLLGVGPGGYEAVAWAMVRAGAQVYGGPEVYGGNTHNDFVQSAVEVGVPGALLLVVLWWLAVSGWWRAWRDRPEGAMILGMLAVLLVGSTIENALHVAAYAPVVGILLGLAAAGPRRA